MAKGKNLCIFIGNVGKDPETRQLPNGGSASSITLACTEQWKDQQSGEKKERTEWIPIVFFNGLSEVAAKYVKKGQQIYVEGAFKTRKWQDKEGKDRYTTEIVAHDLQLLGSRPQQGGEQGQPAQQGYQQQAPARQQAPQQRQQAPSRQPAPAPTAAGGDYGFGDDQDVPF